MIGLPYELFFVLDVESVGLLGEGFAAGWVVVDRKKQLHGLGICCCDPSQADGSDEGRLWVREFVPSLKRNTSSPKNVRRHTWETWVKWKHRGAVMVADCPWPVEARFLLEAARENADIDSFYGLPYPLLDLGSMLAMAGKNPIDEFGRLKDELPEHNPLADAKQSARLLLELLDLVPLQGKI